MPVPNLAQIDNTVVNSLVKNVVDSQQSQQDDSVPGKSDTEGVNTTPNKACEDSLDVQSDDDEVLFSLITP